MFAGVTLLVVTGLVSCCVEGYNLAVVKWNRRAYRACAPSLFNPVLHPGACNPSVELAQLDTDGQEIIGIARLNGRLYVVCVSNDTIFVFQDSSPYTRLDTIQIASLSGMGPGDMVADCCKQVLYIIDWRPASEGGTRVWSVNPYTRTAQYFVNATHWTGTLALTPADGRVLGVLGTGKLNLFSDSTGLTELTLNSAIVAPQHAVKTARGTYYVTQGWTTGQPHRVNEVDATGSPVLRQYGAASPGNGTDQLDWPRYLALGPGNGVLVADYFNRRIVQFKSDLTNPTDVLNAASTPGFGWPNRMLTVGRGKDDRGCRRARATAFELYVAMAENAPSWH